MPDQREEILKFIKFNGPVLPVQIAKQVRTNILFASAMLSELVSSKNIRITHASIGGSPLYYLSGQESFMDERLSKSLNGKEKEIYNLIKEKKVLREKDLEPWQRIAVKNLNDFAVLISVKNNDLVENFWKYHLVNDEDAKNIISNVMDDIYSREQQIQEIVTKVTKEQEVVQTTLHPVQKMQKEVKEFVQEKEVTIKQPLQENNVEQKLETEVKVEKLKLKREIKKEDTHFYSKIIDFIKENKVEVLKEEIVKKNKEFDFVVNINSNFGKLRYLIKAKSKPLINESDVSMAFSEGQIKKMPVILLINGKINKKASLFVEQKMQGQLVLKQI